jgi:hypothetical protein
MEDGFGQLEHHKLVHELGHKLGHMLGHMLDHKLERELQLFDNGERSLEHGQLVLRGQLEPWRHGQLGHDGLMEQRTLELHMLGLHMLGQRMLELREEHHEHILHRLVHELHKLEHGLLVRHEDLVLPSKKRRQFGLVQFRAHLY